LPGLRRAHGRRARGHGLARRDARAVHQRQPRRFPQGARARRALRQFLRHGRRAPRRRGPRPGRRGRARAPRAASEGRGDRRDGARLLPHERGHGIAARPAGKPLVIHTRAAAEDTLRIMREEMAGEAGGVLHCFTESQETADAALALGFHVSFSGIVTFKNAGALKEVARRVPLERLLVETDSPYLAPVPFRGKTNQPAFVRYVAEEVARLREIPADELAAATTRNFFGLFRPPA